MITRLTGTLEALEKLHAVIAPDGPGAAIGYEVLLPGYLSDLLLTTGGPSGNIGRTITLHTLHYLEGVNQGSSFTPRIIGFGSVQERAFFDLLTTVKGLGNRRALRALAIEPGMVARAIVERDTRILQKLPEIGPKLAESIVHELKSKADAFVSLRARVEVLDSAPHLPRTAPASPNTNSSTVLTLGSLIESKETVSPGATAGKPAAEEPAKHKRGSAATNGQTSPRSGPTADAVPPTPPVRQTVQALIALGEQPIEAERMVARAVDLAAGAGELERVLSTAGLLSAAYAAR